MTPNNESELQQFVQITSPKYGCILMRNNSGACVDETGRMVRYGLGHTSPKQQFKSADLIGITKVLITQEMVGTYIGVYTAFEIKKPEWKPTKKLDAHEIKQKNFLDWVTANGGISAFIKSLDDLKTIFRN